MRRLFFTFITIFFFAACGYADKHNLSQGNKTIKILALCYHKIGNGNSIFTIPADKFERNISILLSKGYHTIGINQLFSYLYEDGHLPEKSLLLTFDDGTISNYDYVFPYLVKNHLKGTFFVPTKAIGHPGNLSETNIREMSNNDCCEFGSHSVSHVDLSALNEKDLEEEYRSSQKALEQIVGKKIISFAYPFGILTDRDSPLLKKYGYKLAFTTVHGFNDVQDNPFQLKRIVVENSLSSKLFESVVEGDPETYIKGYNRLCLEAIIRGHNIVADLCKEELLKYKPAISCI